MAGQHSEAPTQSPVTLPTGFLQLERERERGREGVKTRSKGTQAGNQTGKSGMHLQQHSDRFPFCDFRVLLFHHLTSFFLLLQPPGAQSELISSNQPIIALAGDDVILPCYLEPPISVTSKTVMWIRPGLDPKYIHVHDDGRPVYLRQNRLYSNRTALFEDQLMNGNVSLNIYKVKPSDTGTYICTLESTQREVSIQLIVGSVSTPVVELFSNNSGSAVLRCKSEGWYPEPEVLWLDGEGNLLSAGPPETVRGPDDLYTVSSRVTVEKRHSNRFTCRVQQKNINQTRETHIHVPADVIVVKPSYTWVWITLCLGLFFLLILLLLQILNYIKRRRARQDFRNRAENLELSRLSGQKVDPENQRDTEEVQSELISSNQPIIALAGDDVILPCYVEPPISVTSKTVTWIRPGSVSTPVIELFSNNSGSAVLRCKSEGWYPEPEVLWLDGEGNLLSDGPPETVRGPDDLYTVSSRVTVEKRHSNRFTCRVQQKNINQTREAHIHVQADFFRTSYYTVVLYIFAVIAVIAAVSVTVVILWRIKKVGTKRFQEYEPKEKEEKTDGQYNVKKKVIRNSLEDTKRLVIENDYEALPRREKNKQLDLEERSQTKESSGAGNNSEDERQNILQSIERCSRKRIKSTTDQDDMAGGDRKEEWRKSV
ncbi:hypothetical protein L3Q82_003858 [Scortum barcoo]|uniref:Uncharacterized protein n=1 Tax=Scortum barcoo TaxID=214431 RepID=A0ACB8X6C8_9TELE|nr:hypothetical protein L3Q82_003858 [Scortum barcoo]